MSARLRRSLRRLHPADLATAAAVMGRCRQARALLAGAEIGGDVQPPPRPYDHQFVRRLRRVSCAAGRLVAGARDGIAVGTTAAYLLISAKGWPCSLGIGEVDGNVAVRVGLWGADVLGDLPVSARAGRVLTSGPKVPAVGPRSPRGHPSTVSRAHSRPGDSPERALDTLLEPHGGIEGIVGSAECVLLKPNFNSYHPPPASTSFEMMSAVVALLRRAGVKRIAVGECSAVALAPTRRVARRAGLLSWAEREGVEVVLFDEDDWVRCPVAGAHYAEIVIPAVLQQFDRIIYLVSAKTHHEAGVSLALKMGVGMIHPAQRIALHNDHLIERIGDIALAVRPDFAIVDARLCFTRGGPDVGTISEPGLLLASPDIEALDAASIDVLAEHGASGVELGGRQIEAARTARPRASATHAEGGPIAAAT